MSNVIKEIIIKEQETVILARVLLRFGLPFKPYPDFGVWSYLINTKQGVVVFDTGPKYRLRIGSIRIPTKNAENILNTVKSIFPSKKISQILLSHYHFDHSGSAPQLQMLSEKTFKFLPPIRLHKNELTKKTLLRIIPTNLDKLYRKCGHVKWKIGSPIKDGEYINDSSFEAVHTPGHTNGMISLLSSKYNLCIGGWWMDKIEDPLVNLISTLIIDEDKTSLTESKKRIPLGYKRYYLHPKLKYLKK